VWLGRPPARPLPSLAIGRIRLADLGRFVIHCTSTMAAIRTAYQIIHGLPHLLLTLTALFWAGNAIAGRLAINEVSPLALTFLRWVLVCAVLWPLFGRRVVSSWHVLRPHLVLVIAMASFGFTGFNALFYVAAHETTAVNIGIIQGSIPVIVLIGAFLSHRTRVSALQACGVALTLGGVIVVATAGSPQRALSISLNHGDGIMLVACSLYAFYAVALKSRPVIDGHVFFTVLATVAVITSAPLMILELVTGDLILPSVDGWLIALYIALFPSCLAQLFFLRGVDLIGPGRAGVFINLIPVFSAILGVGLLGEAFHVYHGVALFLVLGGILLAQRAPPEDG
jgi:drug/metabolite transporter (DMT)-like permease